MRAFVVRAVEEVESVRGKGFVSRLSSVSSVSSCIYIYIYIYIQIPGAGAAFGEEAGLERGDAKCRHARGE